MPHEEKDCKCRGGAARSDYRKRSGAARDPNSALRNCRAQQERQRRIAGHRIIFLRLRKRQKHQRKARPAQCKQARAPRPIHGLKGKLRDRQENKSSTEIARPYEAAKKKGATRKSNRAGSACS